VAEKIAVDIYAFGWADLQWLGEFVKGSEADTTTELLADATTADIRAIAADIAKKLRVIEGEKRTRIIVPALATNIPTISSPDSANRSHAVRALCSLCRLAYMMRHEHHLGTNVVEVVEPAAATLPVPIQPVQTKGPGCIERNVQQILR